MPEASYSIPATTAEALAKARECAGDYVYFGGGTDIQIHRKHGLSTQRHIIDLSAIEELRKLRCAGDRLEIGSMVTLDELISAADLRKRWPLIVDAARSVATPVIRKSATIGGNLLVKNRCTFYNQSHQWRMAAGSCLRDTGDTCRVTGSKELCNSRNVSDMAAALIALDAQVAIESQNGSRTVPLIDLYVSDGINSIAHMDQDGIITGIIVEFEPSRWWYRKLRVRRSIDFTSLTVAATVDSADTVRVCLNGVSMAPVLIAGKMPELSPETMLKQARRACKIVDNDLLPLSYRREMIGVFLRECWNALQESSQPTG
jgi:4-hydroxybenzoyl-CoA reductase beta subunit